MTAVRKRFSILFLLLGFTLSLFLSVGGAIAPLGLPVQAQIVRINEAAPLVYQQIPSLPLENRYISKKTGKVDEKSTLVARLIRYHAFVKGRPIQYRLDWKLTLADYLQVNDFIEPGTYPGGETLRENPLERDRTVIKSLTRLQRDQLVQVLVNLLQGDRRPS
ncbi:MAG: hypothetical protein VKJ24_07810 [Synechococcales bacterium]|nr:hypothetical protein [Synechococcales bacterium]